MGKLDGKVAFISGVARGQGRSHALTLAREGANIIGFDLCAKPSTTAYPGATEEDLQETARQVKEAGGEIVAEVGDFSRFGNPRQLMAYLGLVPSEHSSGATRRQGGITKAGNGAARRMLIEAAWSYRFPARISREQLLRQEGLVKPSRDTAWKAQERLCRRYRKLARAGKSPTVVTTAIARELAGFVWAIARQV